MEIQDTNINDIEMQESVASNPPAVLPISSEVSTLPVTNESGPLKEVEPRISKVLCMEFKDYRDQTLREKLAYIRQKMSNDNDEVDGDLPNEKGKRPIDIKAKYRKIMRAMVKVNDDKKLKDEIVAFKYATDMSLLRRSTPDEVWSAVKRRAAWEQGQINSLIIRV